MRRQHLSAPFRDVDPETGAPVPESETTYRANQVVQEIVRIMRRDAPDGTRDQVFAAALARYCYSREDIAQAFRHVVFMAIDRLAADVPDDEELQVFREAIAEHIFDAGSE